MRAREDEGKEGGRLRGKRMIVKEEDDCKGGG